MTWSYCSPFSSFPHHILSFFHGRNDNTLQAKVCPVQTWWLKYKILISCMLLWRLEVQDQSTSIIGFLMRAHTLVYRSLLSPQQKQKKASSLLLVLKIQSRGLHPQNPTTTHLSPLLLLSQNNRKWAFYRQ